MARLHACSLATLLFATLMVTGCVGTAGSEVADDRTYVPAPFEELDSLATNDWWNRPDNAIIDLDVARDSVIAFGAYTYSGGTLKMTAQFYPLYPEEPTTVYLDLLRNGEWREVTSSDINPIGWNALLRVDDLETDENIPYRLRHPAGASYSGTIRRPPGKDEEVVVAAMSCNSNKDTGDRDHYVRNVNAIDPDLVFFAGDQSYFHKQHTAAWLLFGKQFRETFRHRPMVSIPDDHDIGQGNLWGEGGKQAERVQGDDGGYYYDADYVRMVERTQTSHLPDPFDPTPVEQGIGVYYTSYALGPVDFAIIEDRKFKSGPLGKVPQRGPRPDHIRDPEYDPASVNLPDLTLLGDRQLDFLAQWGEARDPGIRMKAVLSQTGFCNAAHIHGQLDNRLHADMDSNGWPQDGRDRALELIEAAGAVHIAGDQHLATVIRHGIDAFGDGPWAFVVPAVVNNYYSRWWWPADEEAGENPPPGVALPWVGDYLDGFGNPISMYAYANPDAADNGAGFGVIRFDPEAGEVTFECWPRTADIPSGAAEQFVGWPITVQP